MLRKPVPPLFRRDRDSNRRSSRCRCLVRWQNLRSSRPWECEICGDKVTWPSADHAVLLDLLAAERQRDAKHCRRPPAAPPQNWGIFKRAFANFAVVASMCAVGAALTGRTERRGSRVVRGGARRGRAAPRLGPRIPFWGSS